MKNELNRGLGLFLTGAMVLMVHGLAAQTSNGTDGTFVNPDTRHQSFTPTKVLRSKYKGPNTKLPKPRQSKNRLYSIIPTPTATSGPMTLVHPLTPIPTVAPLIPKDAHGNPITVWAPGQRIAFPTNQSGKN